MAATADVMTPYKGGYSIRHLAMADNVKIYKGALVSVDNTGYARPSRDAVGDVCVGIAKATVDNTLPGHAAGLTFVDVRSGMSARLTGAGFTQANVGTTVEVSSDNVIVAAGGSTNHIHVGKVSSFVSATQLWVEMPTFGIGA